MDTVDKMIIGEEVEIPSISDPRDWLRLVAVRHEFAEKCPCNKGWEELPIKVWNGASGPVVAVLLKQDIKRSGRDDGYGPDRYPYDARLDMDKSDSDPLDDWLLRNRKRKAIAINGRNMGGGEGLCATVFVATLRSWLETFPSDIKIVYLEYVGGVARCDWSVIENLL